MDLTLEINTENQQQNQQQIKLLLIQDTTKAEYSQLLSASSTAKSNRSGDQVLLK